MKIQAITILFQKHQKALCGAQFHYFTESESHQDLHYILRDGQHIVNYTTPDGRRAGISLPDYDVRQVNTVL